MATRSQIIANRRNGRKGGVKTAKGKAITRLNALKHGILSNQAVLQRGGLKENEEEYLAFKEMAITHFQPVGFIESVLVDMLILFLWKWRRAIRAERAAMERSTISSMETARAHEDSHRLVTGQFDKWEPLLRSAESVARFVGEQGLPLSDEAEKELIALRVNEVDGHLAKLAEQFFSLHNYQKLIKQSKLTPADGLFHTIVYKHAQDIVEKIEELRRQEQERDKLQAEAARDAQMFADIPMLELCQRYEGAQFNRFMQALHKLEQVQSKRMGVAVSLEAAVGMIVSGGTLHNSVRFAEDPPRPIAAPQQNVLEIEKMASVRQKLAIR